MWKRKKVVCSLINLVWEINDILTDGDYMYNHKVVIQCETQETFRSSYSIMSSRKEQKLRAWGVRTDFRRDEKGKCAVIPGCLIFHLVFDLL